MPWCDDCNEYRSPNALTQTGDCPDCGEHIEDPSEEADPKVPWHFWVLLAGAVIYLGWRLIQGILWVIG